MYTVEQLIKLLTELPPKAKVVLCHGEDEHGYLLESVDLIKAEHSKTGKEEEVVMLWTS